MKTILLSLIMMLIFAGCSRIESDWRTAQSENSITSYTDYLTKHPQSPHEAEANKRLDDLVWGNAKAKHQLEACEDYVQRFPAGAHVAEAKTLISALKIEALPVFEGDLSWGAGLMMLKSGTQKYELLVGDQTEYKGLQMQGDDVRLQLGAKYRVRGQIITQPPPGNHFVGVRFIEARVIELMQ